MVIRVMRLLEVFIMAIRLLGLIESFGLLGLGLLGLLGYKIIIVRLHKG
jgi:hypothetical protein